VLFGGIGLVFVFGAGVLGLSGPAAARQWLAAAHGPWGLPAAVALFAALAFLGVPQFVLIAAAVGTFGPTLGGLYSWVGTMVSALVGFALGRIWGRGLTSLVRVETLSRWLGLIGRNGFLASLVVRLTPFAPFVAVNLAAGLTAITLRDFVAGTAIGIVPKIVLTALAGDSVARAGSGAWDVAIGLLLAGGLVWGLAAYAARRWIRK
jgi:uncharacterized membrane protein YdjX (TVP38/TMEM64 family)